MFGNLVVLTDLLFFVCLVICVFMRHCSCVPIHLVSHLFYVIVVLFACVYFSPLISLSVYYIPSRFFFPVLLTVCCFVALYMGCNYSNLCCNFINFLLKICHNTHFCLFRDLQMFYEFRELYVLCPKNFCLSR